MTKTGVIFPVVAFCAFVAGTNAFLPVVKVKFVLVDHDPNVSHVEINDYGCHSFETNADENDKVVSVSTRHCLYLFEHQFCEGKRVKVGEGCYQDECCPSDLSKCNFDQFMSSYMLC